MGVRRPFVNLLSSVTRLKGTVVSGSALYALALWCYRMAFLSRPWPHVRGRPKCRRRGISSCGSSRSRRPREASILPR
eukprot:9502082-Pyramimonas_sp.AAC.1